MSKIYTYQSAAPTDQMLLTDIIDLDTGAQVDVQAFLTRDLVEVIQDRNELAGRYARDPDQPWMTCRLCGGAVMLVLTQQRLFHFRHHTSEEGVRDCPISTRGAFSADQINRMKYNAAKESVAHQTLKRIIRDSLYADMHCSEPEVEKVWRGMPVVERATWRKPDVQVYRGAQRFAFEVQLSTTFLTEIVGRREFYRLNGGAIIWVFQGFNPHETRTAEEDIFYLNNLNVFIVNDHTLARSLEAERMVMVCWYAVPHINGRIIVNEWVTQEITLDQLTVDTDRQLVYFYDYLTHRKALETSIGEAALRQQFHDFWRTLSPQYEKDAEQAWIPLRARINDVLPHLELPQSFDDGHFHGVVSIVLSARYGEPVGYRWPRLLNVANHAYDHYKAYLLPFGWTLDAFNQHEMLLAQDTNKTWQKRRALIRIALKGHAPAFCQDVQYNAVLAFLVPEIKDRLMENRRW